MSGLNPKAAFALSVNRNKLVLECNAYHSRVTAARTPPPAPTLRARLPRPISTLTSTPTFAILTMSAAIIGI